MNHLKNDSRYVLLNDNQTLVIKFLALEDDGHYTCIAKNKAGSVQATGTVILTGNNNNFYHAASCLFCDFSQVKLRKFYGRNFIKEE